MTGPLAQLEHLTPGDLAAWAALLLTGLVAWRITRGGGGAAVSELDRANKVLEHRVHDLSAEVRELRSENAQLRERTDFVAAMAGHERNAAARSRQTLDVLNLIAQRLGPDPGTD